MHISLQHVRKDAQADVIALTLRIGREPHECTAQITHTDGIEAARFDDALLAVVVRYPDITRALAHAIFAIYRGRRVQLPILLHVS